jgi:NAD(P)H-dependent flavin oxidoreductase YrpB (nitropropane dioxygenase family)
LLESLGVELPIVQAGMGAGISRHELAAAVSEAGGLGTLGILDPPALRAEVSAARSTTGRSVAVNLLLPFARRGHWEVAEDADVVVTFWGRPRRRTGGVWLHQCGSVDEALAAQAAGADGVIAQGVEAGGHVRGAEPALELLERVRHALPDGYPVLLAGGIAEAADVGAALDAGAEAAVVGTRFLLSEESRAHSEYKRRALAGGETLLTELFGAGWPAQHRVLPNAATERWPSAPGWMRTLHRATAPLLSRTPERLQVVAAARQRPSQPLLGPRPPTDDGPESLLDAGPLYAGETVARIDELRPAGALTRELAP